MIPKKKYEKHGLRNHKLYDVWDAMRRRCYSEKSQEFNRYGERGITVCQEWLDSFVSFYTWSLNNGYEDGLYIDRKDNDIGYNETNCRFVTPTTSSRNTRKIYRHNTSGYRGVSWDKCKNKWMSNITVDKKFKFLGYFDNPEDASECRLQYIKENKLEHN